MREFYFGWVVFVRFLKTSFSQTGHWHVSPATKGFHLTGLREELWKAKRLVTDVNEENEEETKKKWV